VGHPDVAIAVDVELFCAQEPGIIARLAGGVAGGFDVVLARALEQQALRSAAAVDFLRPGARQPAG